jgi:hypothetical protein
MIVGFDFDNTIINYSYLFTALAKKKKLIKKNLKLDKNKIKNFLIQNNKEKEWTEIQGEVYGKEIMKAKIFQGFNNIFRSLLKNGVQVYIVSHKTKYPYLGRKINLRNAALRWIKKNIINRNKDLNFTLKNIYFENSIEDKINRIKVLKCNVFIDDLPSILQLLPKKIEKFLFNPNTNKLKKKFQIIRSWTKINKFKKKIWTQNL